jgi:hypothetical protein
LIKNDDVVKVIYQNLGGIDSNIEISQFNKEITIEKLNSISGSFVKTEIVNKETYSYLIDLFFKTQQNFYNEIFDENNEPLVNSVSNFQYIGNIKIKNNITSLLFLLNISDENNSSYLLLYNVISKRIKSVVVLAEQFNNSPDSGNESFFHKDYFIQLSNFSRVEKDNCSSIFPKSFLNRINIKDKKCTFEYYTMFTIDEKGFIQFINVIE